MELITRARTGDQDAMAELFRRHYPSSLAIARRLVREDDALDAVQSAYLSAFRKFASYRGESSFNTWLTRIVMNQCFLHRRQPAQRRPTVRMHDTPFGKDLRFLIDRGVGPEELALRKEISKALLVALSTLPKPFSEAFTLFTIDGLSIRDTAAKLGISVAATKTRLHRARSRMRSALRAVVKNATTAGRQDLSRSAV